MKIKILPEADARLIAAGEVVERPSSALRELLDNSIDANSSQIIVHTELGGTKHLMVQDDGDGISREDLPLAILPHATSKINNINDLQTTYSLGFRGEALSSLASCCHLEIISKVEDNNAYSIKVSNGDVQSITPCPASKGTTVIARELFYNFPARRRFLKGPNVEDNECFKVFSEKAIAHPYIDFKFYSNNVLKAHYPIASQIERVEQLYGSKMQDKLVLIENSLDLANDGQELVLITSPSTTFRGDKRYIQLYVNRRKIDEYALVQAVLYAYNSIMPKGQFPYCFMFFKVRADLADFNIHPTKHEAKFHILSLMHKQVVNMLSPFISDQMRNNLKPTEDNLLLQSSLNDLIISSTVPTKPEVGKFLNIEELSSSPSDKSLQDSHDAYTDKVRVLELASKQKRDINLSNSFSQNDAWHYYGQLMGVFLMVEWGTNFYLIDQHAAHERILFNQYKKQKLPSQRLISPIKLEVSEIECNQILVNKDDFKEFGVEVRSVSKYTVEIVACPNLMDEYFWLDYIKGLGGDTAKDLYATLACRSAIKEGEYIDDNSAWKLIQATFSLNQPYCPHGRPVWIEISKTQLYRWVKRIV